MTITECNVSDIAIPGNNFIDNTGSIIISDENNVWICQSLYFRDFLFKCENKNMQSGYEKKYKYATTLCNAYVILTNPVINKNTEVSKNKYFRKLL
jgi:hypothetical protein